MVLENMIFLAKIDVSAN